MKEIRKFEEIIANKENQGKSFKELGINPKLFWAYKQSKEVGKEFIDFNDAINDSDIAEIATALREEEITEFTISSTFSDLIETLAAFEKENIMMGSLITIKSCHIDWETGEHKAIPAIKMIVK